MLTRISRRAGGAFLIEETDPEQVFVPEAFGAEDLLIGKTAADFLRKEVLPHTEQIESGDHDLMHRLIQRAGELGLLAADVPEVYGGLDLKQTTAALISEKLNYQQSFALTHEAHTVIGTLPLLYFGNHDQKSRYLPRLASGEWIASFALSEANSGSDAFAMQTRAVLSPDGTHYLMNGEKMWITNTAFAQLFTLFAKVDGEKVTAFLVERDFPGVSFGKEEHKLGMHGTSTRRVILDNVAVPVANAMEVGKGQYAALCALNLGRFRLEAGTIGGLKEILAVCTAYAQQRKAFGHPLSDYGLVRHKLAEMAARTFALESMVYRLAGDLDSVFEGIRADSTEASERYHHASEEFAIECGIIKVIGSETYSRMTDEAIQIHGGYGYTEDYPVARAWRDQRLLRIGEGANEIVRLAILNLLLRRDKLGRLPVLEVAQRTAEEMDADYIERSVPKEVSTMVLEAARATKRMALYLLHLACKRYGTKLNEAQEIVAAIADVICSAYALESIGLRCETLKRSKTPRLGIVQVAALDYAGEALQAADYALICMEQPTLVESDLVGVAETYEILRLPGLNPMSLRRDLAALVIEKAGYPI